MECETNGQIGSKYGTINELRKDQLPWRRTYGSGHIKECPKTNDDIETNGRIEEVIWR